MPVIAIGQPLSSSHRALDQPYGAEFPSPIPEGEEGAATVDASVDIDMEGEADGSASGVRDRGVMAGPQADAPVAAGGRQHVNNHSIDSGVAFNRSPVTIKTVPLPTAPLPLVEDDCDTLTPSTAHPETSTDPSRSWPHNAVAGPSSSAPDPPTGHPSNAHSAVPPPAQPRRHRSGVLMSQARSRSRANSGGHVTGGFTSSKSFGELNLMGLHMSSMSSAMASASTTSVGNAHAGSGMDGDGSAGESEGWEDGREGRDGHGRRVTSEGSLRAGMDDGQMWDNSARFYHHLQSRPQSRQTSPDRLHTSTYSHRSGDASPTSSSTHTSPIYVRRSATLPHAPHGAGPPSLSHNHMQVNAHGHHAIHPSAALSPNQAFLSSHLPPIFNPSPGSSPEYGHAHSHGSGAHGLGAPQQHSMVILTPTTAEWKELKKEMGDMEQDQVDSSDGSGSGSGSGPEDSDGSISVDGSRSGTSDGTRSGESSPGSMRAEGDQEGQVGRNGKVPDESQRTAAVSRTNGLMLDHNGSTTPDLDIPAFHRPPIRPTLSADFLSGELSHGPDPGASPPRQQGDSLGGEETGVSKWSHHHTHRGSLSAGPPVFMQKVIAPSPILPDTPSMADTPPISPVIADGDGSHAQAGQMGHEANGEELKVAGEDEAILDEPTRIERFSSIGRRDSLKAVSKVRLPRTKTRRELERERLFKDLDEELEKDQDSPKAFEPVIAIGNGLGLVRDTSSGASSAPVPVGGTGAGLSRNSSLRSESGAIPTRTQVGSGATGDSHADMARATGAAAAGASEGYFTTGARIEGSLGVNAGPVAKVTPVASVPARSQTDPAPSTATVTRTSPSQPIKPSPLHASPITALSAISSPSESPAVPVQIPKSPSATARTLSGSRKRTTSRPFSRTHSRQTSVAAQEANLETIRSFARSIEHPHSPRIEIMNPLASPPPMAIESGGSSPKGVSPPERRRRDTKRVSLVAGRVVQPFMIPPSTALPPDRSHPGSASPATKKASLNSFSPFRTPAVTPSGSMASSMHTHNLTSSGPGSLTALSALGGLSGAGASIMNAKPGFPRFDSSISVAASTAPPSEPGTPGSETAGGLGGRGIEDYCILSEAGKGAYGLVMRAKVKGRNGEPVGEEVIIKYIVKARILADCWKKHKQLGPIPVEIFVMDQLRHLLYNTPAKPHAWDPARSRAGTGGIADGTSTPVSAPSTPPPGSNRPVLTPLQRQSSNTPDSMRSGHSQSFFGSAAKYLQGELKISPDRGHPNICKLLDFFEDREFYYMVMPRFGSGLDLFDRVEACPDGLSAFEIRSLIGQLADAVRFLHQNGIVHRDIKDENVILDGEGRCQLIDFGSAAQWRPGKRWDTFSGTLHYASPEILRGELYSGKEQDVYALGTVMYVLLVGETPFGQLPDEVLEGLKEGTKAMVALQERCSAERQAAEDVQEADGGGRLADALDLVQRCLEMEVQDRPPADVLVTHRFVKGEGGWTGYRGWGPKK